MNQKGEYQQLENRLMILLESEPFEDGITHPAEETISKFLKEYPVNGLEQIEKLFVNYYEKNPYYAKGILHCLRHMNRETISPIGYPIAKKGLKHEDIEMRDLSVSALENWAGQEALNILISHNESCSWLKKYILKVIKDLKKSN